MQFSLRAFSYFIYTTTTKIRQIPDVISELTPKIDNDETIRPADSEKYAIIVNFSKFGVPENLRDLLATLRRSKVNPIVVCNGKPKPEDLAHLKVDAHRILVRRNIGRDMGAYRAATLYLNAQGLAASRVLYFNDSVIYLAGPKLDAMVDQLANSPYAVTGAFENHELEHHVGSFAFAVDGGIFRDRRFLKFWRKYRPYDLRPHAIQRGEMELSKAFKKIGCDIDIIYSTDKLSEILYAMNYGEIVDLIPYMSPIWRAHFFEHARHTRSGFRQNIARELSASIRPTRRPHPDREAAGDDDVDLDGGPLIAPSSAARLDASFEALSKAEMLDAIVENVSDHSQVHFGFGLFYRLMDVPIVKKDLLQRNIYKEHDCNLILSDLPVEVRRQVMRQLINRGRQVYVTGIKRFKIRQGLE